jgi:hypothetical protein
LESHFSIWGGLIAFFPLQAVRSGHILKPSFALLSLPVPHLAYCMTLVDFDMIARVSTSLLPRL